MSTYYNGNVDDDLARIEDWEEPLLLQSLGRKIGFGRCQQILQILWADELRKSGYPTSGALGAKDPK